MNGVIGMGELLLETELDPRQRQFAKLILSSTGSLLTLVNSLLDFSKIEAEEMLLECRSFNLKELIDEIMALYMLTGRRKGLDVTLDLDFELAASYQGDVFRLREVLVNLLGNAVKFTDHGKVVLSVSQEDTTDPELIRFTVTDSGAGIPGDKQDQLFIAFSQVDSSSTRKYGGTGLGLSICKKLVELMGGSIDFSSKAGQGSSFWFTLRLPKSEVGASDVSLPQPELLPSLPQALAVTSRPANILIVDDDETNRMVTREFFRKTDALITTAKNGKQAVQLCGQQSFDLILMDCRMPVMDGYEATERIRKQQNQSDGREPVILALTADVTNAAMKQCNEVGMDDYLVKPLEMAQLQDMLDSRMSDFKLSILPETVTEDERKAVQDVQGVEFDFEALENLRQNIGEIKSVLTVFLNLLPGRLQEFERAVRDQDAEKIQSIAHILKGSCNQFGARALADLCAQAEQMGKNNDLKEIDSLHDELQLAVEAVTEILEEHLD